VILRIVLATVLTAALLSVATPAMSAAGADRADSTIERQLATLADELETMVETDDPTRGPGARHVSELRVPARTLTSAGVSHVRFDSHEGVGLATWQTGDGGTGSARLAGVPIRAVDGSLTLRETGTHKLVFALRSRGDRPVLTVGRLDGDGDA
jgi:hypothetical protein